MDENTKFLIHRMDTMESRLSEKMDVFSEKMDTLQAFRHKIVGVGLIAGSIASIVMEIVFKRFL